MRRPKSRTEDRADDGTGEDDDEHELQVVETIVALPYPTAFRRAICSRWVAHETSQDHVQEERRDPRKIGGMVVAMVWFWRISSSMKRCDG